MRSVVLVAAVLAVGMAGCLGGDGSPASAGPEVEEGGEEGLAVANATTAMGECPSSRGIDCFEPSIAVDDEGRIFATNTPCEAIARSMDGVESFEEIGVPPLPLEAPPGPRRGDCTLDIGPEGRLFYSALTYELLAGVGGQEIAGIHVAASDDGGETWETNTWVHPASRDANTNTNTDRQWLSFGDGSIYLTYWQFRPGQSWIAVSGDGGESFEPFQQMPGFLPGDPVATGGSTIHVPWLEAPYASGDYGVRISTSTDGGASFELHPVHDGSGGVGGAYPGLVEGAEGQLFVAWIDAEGRLLVVTGSPGRGFVEPTVWNANATAANPDVPPDLHVHGGVLDVAWYRQVDDEQRYVLARGPVSLNASEVTIHEIGTIGSDESVSDFTAFDQTSDGRDVFTWTDPDVGLQVARELPAS